MPYRITIRTVATTLAAMLLGGVAIDARADAVSDCNAAAGSLVAEAKLGTPPAIRVMALVHTGVHEAVTAVAPRQDAAGGPSRHTTGAAAEAAIAGACRLALTKLLPAQQGPIEAAYRTALASIPEGADKSEGIAAGERAAAAVLARRVPDATVPVDAYRPHAIAGAWVPTSAPAAVLWPQRRPWLMTSASQFRPGPPPALTSETWARDYNEVKAVGAKGSAVRTAEQSEIARFWEYSLPSIYFGVVRSVAELPGRGFARNAALFAAAAQAMDDAMIGVFEAKYHYNFWRPATAIRNGDVDGNDATERDAEWTSFIDAPLHPEYPSAHAILAGAVAAVLKAEIGSGHAPVLATTSPTAKGATRRWTRVDDFVAEVMSARIFEGIHFRTSTEAGAAMGRRIGELAAAAFLQPQH